MLLVDGGLLLAFTVFLLYVIVFLQSDFIVKSLRERERERKWRVKGCSNTIMYEDVLCTDNRISLINHIEIFSSASHTDNLVPPDWREGEVCEPSKFPYMCSHKRPHLPHSSFSLCLSLYPAHTHTHTATSLFLFNESHNDRQKDRGGAAPPSGERTRVSVRVFALLAYTLCTSLCCYLKIIIIIIIIKPCNL